jgi:hypothetical protein
MPPVSRPASWTSRDSARPPSPSATESPAPPSPNSSSHGRRRSASRPRGGCVQNAPATPTAKPD